jgi:hypothetical protein
MSMLGATGFNYFMLQRDRQIRTQVHQLVDACLFAASFWLAYAVRATPWFTAGWGWMLRHPAGCLLQQGGGLYFRAGSGRAAGAGIAGFYNRPAVGSRPGHCLAAVARHPD